MKIKNNQVEHSSQLPERVQQNIAECWDEETKEFDWDYYQYLCDCQSDCEE